MANLMKMKRSSVPGKVPTTADLDLGEIAINTYDGKVYMKKNVSGVETIVLLTGAGAGDVLGPASSGDKAIARFSGTSGKTIQNSSATIDDSGNITALSHKSTGTSADQMSVGTTAQRPASPVAGMYRMNSTTGEPEWWDANASRWQPFRDLTYDIEYIVIAGGGGGGNNGGSGGGAGGYRSSVIGESSGGGASAESVLTLAAGFSTSIVVGAGGAQNARYVGSYYCGGQGSNSSLGSITSIGGGYGQVGGATQDYAGSGGSGGGAAIYNSIGTTTGASGTSGQGYKGGDAPYSGGGYFVTGGGGGAGSAGQNGTQYSNLGGLGGAGVTSNINGTPTPRASGGSSYNQTSATAGGGGAQSANGAANTGGGGGVNNTAGGSGVVILRYKGSQRGTGGTVTTATISGQLYTIHTFTSSGTFTA